jgi:indole-3-glycerol phosphate synthase
MSNFKPSFDQIMELKKKDLRKSMQKMSLSDIKNTLKDVESPQNFKKALQNKKNFPLICEYKPASPSMGEISQMGLEEAVDIFKEGGASALSILTEKNFFKGDIEYLALASKLTDIPIMRKDFILDEYHIFEARAFGASSVLLMSEIYPNIAKGIETCRSLGMEPLIECKNSIDVYNALDADAEIVGINNRSFKDFSIDLDRTKALAQLIPEDIILVSESGVKNKEDVKKLCEYGADALLIGTSLMLAENIVETIYEYINTADNSLKSIYNSNSSRRNRKSGVESFEQFA